MSLLSDTLERHLRELQHPTPVPVKPATKIEYPDIQCGKSVCRFVSLYFCDGASDKVYHLQLVSGPGPGEYSVEFQYGRRGRVLTHGTKTPQPVTFDEAERIYQKIFHEKITKGYTTI